MRPERRKFLTGAGGIALTTIAGCLGGGGDGGDGGGGDGGDGGGGDGGGDGGGSTSGSMPSPPWTTEELAEIAIDKGQTDIRYITTGGDPDQERARAEFISETFSNGEINVTAQVVKDQRALQELQADNLSFSVGKVGSEIHEMEGGWEANTVPLRGNLAVLEGTPEFFGDHNILDYQSGFLKYSTIYNTEIITSEQEELLLEKNWNAFLEEPFSGFKVVQDASPKYKYWGIITELWPSEVNMSIEEWLNVHLDNLEWAWQDGHSSSSRFVGQGSAGAQWMSYANHVIEFGENGGMPLKVALPPEDKAYNFHSGTGAVPKGAPNKEAGLWYISALFEEETQRWMASNTSYPPGRVDLEYPEAPEFMRRTVEPISMENSITFERQRELEKQGEEAFKQVFGDLVPEYE